MIKLRYEEGCKPQVQEQGNKYLLFCKQDFLLPKRTDAYVDTGVEAYGGIFRINPGGSTLARYGFKANKTIFMCEKGYEKVKIKINGMINKDIVIKAGTVLCEIEGINGAIVF